MSGEHERSGGCGDAPYNNNLVIPKMTQDVTDKALLLATIKDDPLSADLKWSLFRGAFESYKYDSLLKPFPKNYIDKSGEKNIEELRTLAAKLRSISDALDQLTANSMPEDLMQLFQWVLSEGISSKLRYVKKTEQAKVLERVEGGLKGSPLPSHIFEVISPPSASLGKFNRLIETFGSRWGFHGSRLENYVSILNYGLQGCMMKVGAFGPGVYLASDLGISLQFSPHGLSWGGSALGGLLSLVALCEMVACPGVRCHAGNKPGGDGDVDVPKNYFIVENSELVRVRYLFVYGKKNRRGPSRTCLQPSNFLRGNLRFFVFVTSVLVIIACTLGKTRVQQLIEKVQSLI